MKPFVRSAVIALCLSVLSPAGFAQEQPQFTMPCSDVLKLGLDKFVEAYGEKTQDYSTYGQKQAYGYYVDCKRPANDQRAQRLSEIQRKQVDAVRDGLNEIGNASWGNAYIVAGGGTMYGLASVSAYAVREDVIASLIATLASQGPNPRSRRRANAALARARRALPDSRRMPTLEYWDTGDRPNQIKAYRENSARIKKGFTEVERLIRLLPDRAAELVARRLEDELDVGFDE